MANLQQQAAGASSSSGAEKSSRSSRMMRPSVQGLVIEEEEEDGGGCRRGSVNSTGIYYDRGKRRKSSNEYAQYDNFLNGEDRILIRNARRARPLHYILLQVQTSRLAQVHSKSP